MQNVFVAKPHIVKLFTSSVYSGLRERVKWSNTVMV